MGTRNLGASALFILLSSGPFARAADIAPLIKARPTRASSAAELIHWEAFRLTYGQTNQNPQVEFLPGTSLEETIRERLEGLEKDRLGPMAAGRNLKPTGPLSLIQVLDAFHRGRPELTEDLKAELLTVLRLQAEKGNLTGNAAERMKRLMIRELAAWVLDPQVPLVLPAALRAKLTEAARAMAAAEVPPRAITKAQISALLRDGAAVVRLAESLGADAFDPGQWAKIGGGLRITARVERPNTFLADFREEVGRFLAVVGPQEQRGRGIQTPRIPYQGPRPSFRIPGTPSPAPRLEGRNGGFPRRADLNPGNGPRSGVVSLDGPLPLETFLTPEQRARLRALRDRGHVSLPMVTFYPRSPPSACQVTLVGNPPEPPQPGPNNKCLWNAMTARHCVEDDNEVLFSHVQIPPFDQIVVKKIEADGTGGDLAMFSFESECRADLPMVAVAMIPARDGEGIMVHAAIPLIGQASLNGSNNNRLMMNVRDRENAGVGIEHGNSGGAVTNDSGEIVGVISTKLLGRENHGIGFFATGQSLYFANRFLNPNFNLGGLRSQPSRSTASLEEPDHD